jgi:hypothetical protein
MIPRDRGLKTQLLIGRTDGETWEDLAPFLKRAEVSLGDVAAIGSEASGVDSVVRTIDFTLRGDNDNRFAPLDRDSAWNQFGGDYAPLLWPNREVMLRTEIETPLAVSRREILQADFASGTLTNVQATAAGNLEMATPKAAPIFVRPTVANMRDGSQVASGVARYEAGQFGQGLMIEEGTTNFYGNPSAEADLTGWSAVYRCNLVRDNAYAWHGQWSAEFTTTSPGASFYGVCGGGDIMGPAIGGTYTASMWVRPYQGHSMAVQIELICFDSGGGVVGQYSSGFSGTGTGLWERLSVTFTVPAGTARVETRVRGSGTTGDGCIVHVDAVQFEQKACFTTFMDGTRAAETLTIPTAGVLTSAAGFVGGWFYENGTAPAWRNLWDSDGSRFFCAYDGSVNKYRVMVNGVWPLETPRPSVGLHFIVVAWTGTAVALFIDGILVASDTLPTPVSFAGTTTLYLGSNFGGQYQWNDVIDDFFVKSYWPTDAEILAEYAAGVAYPVDERTTYKLDLDGNLNHGEGGYRTSPVIDLSPAGRIAGGSNITWTATAPAGTTVGMETNVSLDGGTTWEGWQAPTNGGPIAGLTEGLDLTNVRLQLRESLTANDTATLPQLNDTWLVVRGVKRVWTTPFHGYLGDRIKPQADGTVSCFCRDLAKRLQDHYIEGVWDEDLEKYVPRSYGSEAGVLSETVIQQVLDDELGTGRANVGSSGITLYCPVSSGYAITKLEPQYASLWDVLQNIAGQRAWFLGFRPHPTTGEYVLTYMEPPRAKSATTADFALDYMDDFYVQDLDITDTDVRNVVKVTYRDKEAAGKRKTLLFKDDDSIAEYGRRAMEIEEADTSQIDTAAEATTLGQAALADLKDLTAAVHLDMPYLPNMDVFAGITVNNPRVSSTVDFYGVESVRHTLEWPDGDGEECRFRTEVVGSGRVVGAHTRWLEMETRPGAAPPIPPGAIQTGAVDTDRIGIYAVSASSAQEIEDTFGTSTTSTDWVDIPAFRVDFTLAEEARCLFYANLRLEVTLLTLVAIEQHLQGDFRLTVDGIVAPSSLRYVSEFMPANASGVGFFAAVAVELCRVFAAGEHSIAGQFKCGVGADRVRAWDRNMGVIILKR